MKSRETPHDGGGQSMGLLDLELPFGMAPDGRMVPVHAVPRGLACDCRCPRCQRRLIARQGDVVRWHFAHEPAEDVAHGGGSPDLCVGAFETMLHRVAKQIIADHGTIRIPVLTGFHAGFPTLSVEPAADIALIDLRLETWRDGIRPDVIATRADDQTDLVVEVYVTHSCEPAKINLLRQRDIAAIELDLSGYRGEVGLPLLTDLVLRNAHREWLHHPRQAQADAAATAYVIQQREEQAHRDRAAADALRELEAAQRAHAKRIADERWWSEHRAREASDAAQSAARIQRLADERERAIQDRIAAICREAEDADRAERAKIAAAQRAERERIIADERSQRAEDQRRRDAHAQDDLRRHAIEALRSTELAEQWMRTTHPRLGFKRPVEVCANPYGLARCVEILRAEGKRAGNKLRLYYRE